MAAALNHQHSRGEQSRSECTIVSVRVLIKLKWTVINPSELVLDGATLNSAPRASSLCGPALHQRRPGRTSDVCVWMDACRDRGHHFLLGRRRLTHSLTIRAD